MPRSVLGEYGKGQPGNLVDMLESLVSGPLDFFDALGVLGAILYIGNYARLVLRRASADNASYFVVNLLAASLVLTSLTQVFNLGAALIQLFFVAMSLLGIVDRWQPLRRLWRRRQPTLAQQPIRWTRPGLDRNVSGGGSHGY